jgi:AcrR family transcriptional regulator
MRGRVLDAAAEAFQARGYHSTSTHDIMRDAQVTAGALHHHFPTKKSIGLAVIRERVAQAVEATWIAPVRAAPTTLDGVLSVFRAIAAGLDARGRVLGCPLNNLALELSVVDSDFQTAIRTVFEDWRVALADKVRADVASGALRNVVPKDLATLIVSSYSGAISIAKANQSSEPLKRCAKELAALLRSSRRQVNRKRQPARASKSSRPGRSSRS